MYKASIYPLSNLLWAWSTSCENTLIIFASDRKKLSLVKGQRATTGCCPSPRTVRSPLTNSAKKNSKYAGRDCILSKITNDLRSLIYPVLFFNASFIFVFVELFIHRYTVILHQYNCQYFFATDETSMYRWKYIHSLNRHK